MPLSCLLLGIAASFCSCFLDGCVVESGELMDGGEEARELEVAMLRTGRICRCLKYICIACLAIFSLAWVILVWSMVVSLANQQQGLLIPKEFLYVAMHGLVVIALLYAATQSFSNVARGFSPFTMKQVNLFRLASLLLILLAVIDAILSTGFLFDFEIAGLDIVANEGWQMEPAKLNIDMMTVFFAAILFGVSVLFRYGNLLQRLTDETE